MGMVNNEKKDGKKISLKDNLGVKLAGATVLGTAVGSSATAFASNLLDGDDDVVVKDEQNDVPENDKPEDNQESEAANIEKTASSNSSAHSRAHTGGSAETPENGDAPRTVNNGGGEVAPHSNGGGNTPNQPVKPTEPVEPTEPTEPVEPAEPVVEIDPDDIDAPNNLSDVTSMEIEYDVNGNPMVVAHAHNAEFGDFAMVDVDSDGDFDLLLTENKGAIDMGSEADQLITVADVQASMTDDYIPATQEDVTMIAENIASADIDQDVVLV